MPHLPDRHVLRTAVEVLCFAALWWACDALVRAWHWPVPASVVGLLALTVVLLLGWLPAGQIERGARWLLGDMLLFVIPPLMAIVRHTDLFGWQGFKLAVAIVVGTLLVMWVVGWVVQRVITWEDRLHQRRHAR